MKYSKNYNFNLPESESDDIANIDQISDNFKKIDAVMNETDQTFEPTSTKAASGKAVNEAISGINPIDENTEFIFDGGDASGAIPVDIVIDDSLSKTSSNAIMNKAVASAIDNLKNMIEQAKKDVLLDVFPVGAIYIALSSTAPDTIFGGTWERIKGYFLWGAGEGETAGETGGEKEHTLTLSEIPEHSHTEYADFGTGALYNLVSTQATGGAVAGKYFNASIGTDETTNAINTGIAGNGVAHNNMPPYMAVYIWKRTA